MTLPYCSLSCWSSASLVNEHCSTTEKVPRIPQTTATVTEIVRISRAEIDRSLNMGPPKLRQKGEFGTSQIMFNNLRLTRWSAVLPISLHLLNSHVIRSPKTLTRPGHQREDARSLSSGHALRGPVSASVQIMRQALLGVVCRCAGIGGEDHLADVFVMRVAGLDLLRDGVHIAEAALESVGAEHRRGAGHVIGGIDHRGCLMDGPGRRQEKRCAMLLREVSVARQIAPHLCGRRIEIGARRAQTGLVAPDRALNGVVLVHLLETGRRLAARQIDGGVERGARDPDRDRGKAEAEYHVGGEPAERALFTPCCGIVTQCR